MKRLILATAAISLLAAPIAQAQPRQHGSADHRYERQVVKPRHAMPSEYRDFRKKPKQHRWSRGERVPSWQRGHVVREWHRHGLRKPPRGQQWVRVNNDYLLIGISSGLIAGIMLGR